MYFVRREVIIIDQRLPRCRHGPHHLLASGNSVQRMVGP